MKREKNQFLFRVSHSSTLKLCFMASTHLFSLFIHAYHAYGAIRPYIYSFIHTYLLTYVYIYIYIYIIYIETYLISPSPCHSPFQLEQEDGRLHKAAQFYEEFIGTFVVEDGNDTLLFWRALCDYGLLLEDIDRLEESLESFEQAVHINRTQLSILGSLHLIETLGHLARILESLGRFQDAELVVLEALSLTGDAFPPEPSKLAGVGIGGLPSSYEANVTNASSHSKVPESPMKKLQLYQLTSTLHSTAARIYLALNRYEEALTYAHQALFLMDVDVDHSKNGGLNSGCEPYASHGTLHLTIGDAFFGLGQFRNAAHQYRMELSICGGQSDALETYAVMDRMALALQSSGRLIESNSWRVQAIDVAQRTGNRVLRACALTRAAEALMLCGHKLAAIRFAVSALKLCRQGTDAAVVHGNLGMINMYFGDLDRAQDCFRMETLAAEQMQDKRSLAIAFEHLGHSHAASKDVTKCIVFYEQALKIWREVYTDWQQQANIFGCMATAYYEAGDYNRSKCFRERQFQIFKSHPCDIKSKAEAEYQYGLLQLQCADRDEVSRKSCAQETTVKETGVEKRSSSARPSTSTGRGSHSNHSDSLAADAPTSFSATISSSTLSHATTSPSNASNSTIATSTSTSNTFTTTSASSHSVFNDVNVSGDNGAALAHRHFQNSLELYIHSRNASGAVAAYMQLGRLSEQTSVLTAIGCFETAATLCYEFSLGASDTAEAHMHAGRLCLEYGRLDSALRHFHQAATLYDLLKDAVAHADSYGHICNVHIFQGNYNLAIEGLLVYTSWCSERGDKTGEMVAWSNLGYAYMLSNKPLDALQAHRKSLGLAIQLQDIFGQAEALRAVAEACQAVDHHRLALLRIGEAIVLYRQLDAANDDLDHETREDVKEGLWKSERMQCMCEYALANQPFQSSTSLVFSRPSMSALVEEDGEDQAVNIGQGKGQLKGSSYVSKSVDVQSRGVPASFVAFGTGFTRHLSED